MTIQELAEKYNYSVTTIQKKWPEVKNKILRDTGIKIVKEGRGAAANYYEEVEADNRALTMYQEVREDVFLTTESISFINWEFSVFLAVVTTPMRVFRGNIEQLLQYMELPTTPHARECCIAAIRSLIDKNYIDYLVDKTDPDYFVLMIYRQVETDMKISYSMLSICKQLALKYNKRDCSNLLKTWIGVQMLAEDQPYTVASLEQLTGLSAYQIREANKILQESQIYKTSKAYAGCTKCLGTNVDLNHEAFYDLD